MMKRRELNVLISRFAFVLTSSFMMVMGINLSFFFFAYLLLLVVRSRGFGKFFLISGWLRIFVALFMFGILASMFYHFTIGNIMQVKSSLQVIPNYIYWGILILLFVNLGELRCLNYSQLFMGVSCGAILAILYYVLFQDFEFNKLFLKSFQKNNIAFLIICYTPYIVYTLKLKMHHLVALAVLAAILFFQLLDGRRAGFLLAMLGGLLAFRIDLLKFSSIFQILRPIAVAMVALFLLYTNFVEGFINSKSERIHEVIYELSDETISNDRSILVRKAMVEKGLNIFRQNLLFGVGLNNFTKTEMAIEGNFVGAKYVVDKDIYERTSSHNSYINFLAEGGLSLAVPTVAIFLLLLVTAFKRFGSLKDPEKVILVSFLLMCIHFYYMTSIVNSLAWFNIAMLAYVASCPRDDKARRVHSNKAKIKK